MPRVTEVLGYHTPPELINWIEKNSKKKREAIRDEAFRVGSAVDALVQQDIKDGGYLSPEGDSPIENCLAGWEAFKKEHPLFVDTVDASQMQRDLKVGNLTGHPDFVIRRGSTWGVMDLKCASGIRPTYFTQCAAYTDMIKTLDGLDSPSFIGVVRLDKKDAGRFEYVEITDKDYIAYEVEVFKAYLTAFNHSMFTKETLRQQLENETLED